MWTEFGDRVLKAVNKVKGGCKDGAQFNDRCPYKKRKFGHQNKHQKEI